MLQGVGSEQRAAVFDPSTGFPRGGKEMEGTALLLICGVKVKNKIRVQTRISANLITHVVLSSIFYFLVVTLKAMETG